MNHMWKEMERDPDAEGPYWVTFTDTGDAKLWLWKAVVKWDGCIEFHGKLNGPNSDDVERIHLCELDETVKRLQALRDAAKAVLGPRHGLYEDGE